MTNSPVPAGMMQSVTALWHRSETLSVSWKERMTKMRHLRCKKCGQTSAFRGTVIEYHDWIVDNQGNFEKDLGCEDTNDKSTEYACYGSDCDGWAEWVED